MKFKILFFSLLLLIISCSQEGLKMQSRSEYHSNHKEDYEKQKLFDSIMQFGLDSMQNGDFIDYYSSGIISKKGRYLNNKKDGWFISYYEDGKIEYSAFYIDNYSFGEFKYYHPDEIVETYTCFYSFLPEYRGEVFYKSRYNKNGELIYEDGYYRPYIITYASNENLLIDSVWKADIYLAQPPHMNNSLSIMIYDENEKLIVNEDVVFDRGYCNYFFKYHFSEKGEYQFFAISDIKNKPSYIDTAYIDSVSIEIHVK